VEKGKETWTICLLQAEIRFSVLVLLVFDLLLPMRLICFFFSNTQESCVSLY